MKRYLLCFCILFALFPLHSYASSVAGADIAYYWLHDSTYQIEYRFYQDCASSSISDSVLLCYSNTCGYAGGTTTLYRDSLIGTIEVQYTCPGHPTRCSSVSSVLPGFREWYYMGTVTLSGRCDHWTFSHAEPVRNAAIKNLSGAGTAYMYVETTFDNLDAPGPNSSPYFTSYPPVILSDSSLGAVYFSAYDNNNDSLSYESIDPLTGSNCSSSAEPFNSGYSLPYNPLDCNNSYAFDPLTGIATFTPTANGLYVLAARVNEYRKIGSLWIKIGSAIRDMEVYVITNSNPTPTAALVPSSVAGAVVSHDTIYACTGVDFSFSFDCKTSDTTHVIGIYNSDNFKNSSVLTSFYNKTYDSIRGVVSCRVGIQDTGLKLYTVFVFDSTCTNGLYKSATYSFPIYLWPATTIVKTNTPLFSYLCAGDKDSLTVVGGTGFTWNVLPGGSPISSLSCTTCQSPVAIPLKNTSYVVSATNTHCHSRDTFSQWVLPVDTIRSISAINPVCIDDTLKLSPYTWYGDSIGYVWTGPGNYKFSSPNDTGAFWYDTGYNWVAWRYPPVAGTYYVTEYNSWTCPSPPDSIVVSVSLGPPPPKPQLLSNSPICAGDTLFLDATDSNPAVSYLWHGPHGYSSILPSPFIPNAPADMSGWYTVKALLNGCYSKPDSNHINIYYPPVILRQPQNVSTCSNSKVVISINATGDPLSFNWQINTGNGFADITDVSPYPFGVDKQDLMIIPSAGMNAYQYRCVLTGFCDPKTVISDTVTLSVTSKYVWLGTVDNDWLNGGNWSCNQPPDTTSNVLILPAPNMPVIDNYGYCDSLTLAPGTTLSFVNDRPLYINGSVIDQGKGFNATNGRVYFLGNGQQLIPGSEYYALTLSGGQHKILSGDITIDSALELDTSMLVLNGHNLKARWNTLLSGTGYNAHFITDKKSRVLVQGAGFFNDSLIPLGTSDASYTPLQITPSFYADTMLVSVFDSVYNNVDHNFIPSVNAYTQNVVNKTWYIDYVPRNGLNATITFQWDAKDQLPGFDRNACYLSNYNYPNWSAGEIGTIYGNGPYQLQAKVESFGYFSIGGPFPSNSYSPIPRIMSIYPDPATGDLVYVKFDKPLSQQVNIYVRDVYGRELFKKQVNPFDYKNAIIPVVISTLSKGVYMIVLEDVLNNNELHIGKFVKD